MKRFKVGDRVKIARGHFVGDDRQGCWHLGSIGTVIKVSKTGHGHCGDRPIDEGDDHDRRINGHEHTLGVRWDSYARYGDSNPSNCHTVCSYIVDSDDVDPDELAEALRSITQALQSQGMETL